MPHLIKLLWLFQDSFPKVIQSISKNIPLLNLPNRIRFGIAGGSVHRFEFKFAKGFEYVGYPINLACRLQNYADELTFLVSARSGARPRLVGFQRVIARKLKGFPNELVYVMKTELSSMNDKRKISHFETPPVHHLDLNVVRELASQVQIPKRSMKQRVKSI